jgi:uncharacterized protein (TIGR02598 family)
MKRAPSIRRYNRAFSLVEVASAIGIAAFSLVAIMSLFATLLSTEREAITQTTIPAISASVLRTLKIEQQSGSTNSDPLIYHFTHEGSRIYESDAARLAVYSCEVTLFPATVSGVLDPGPRVSLVRIQIRRPNATHVLRTVYASVRYE